MKAISPSENGKVLSKDDSRLTAVINRTPNKALSIAYNARGGKWIERQLNQAFDQLLTGLAKEANVRAANDDQGEIYCPLEIHGLRHARGVELAQADASDSEIMGQLEHSTNRSAAEYRRQAERLKLADTGQDKVHNVVRLRDAKRAQNAKATSK